MRNYFIFKGIHSSQLAIEVIDPLPSIVKASKNVETVKISGLDGSFNYTNGTYNNRTITVNCYIRTSENIAQIKRLLDGTGELTLGTESNKVTNATINNELVFNHSLLYDRYYFSVVFSLDPTSSLLNTEKIILTESNNIINLGDLVCYPTFRVYVNTYGNDILFSVGGKEYSTDQVFEYVDFDLTGVRWGSLNYTSMSTGDMPITLDLGTTNIQLLSNIDRIEITINERFL